MKKLSLLMMGLALAASANAADWYLIGGFNGWSLADEDYAFSLGEDGKYYLEGVDVTAGDFKINQGDWDSESYGDSGTQLVLGQPYSLYLSAGSANINLAYNLTNADFVLDTAAGTLTITGSEAAATYSYDLWGSWGGPNWGSTTLTENEDGLWVSEPLTLTATETFGIRMINDLSGSQAAWYAAASTTTISESTEVNIILNGTNMTIKPGTYTFTYDPAGILSVECTEQGEDPIPPTPVESDIIYFDNASSNWAKVYLHYWGGAEASTWPGAEMTKGESTIYAYRLPAGTTGIIFNNGSGTQTADITGADLVPGYVYSIANGGWTLSTEPYDGPAILPEDSEDEYPELYVVGNINDWKAVEAYKMTREGNVYTLTLEDGITAGWKIDDGTWAYGYGLGEDELVNKELCNVWSNGLNINTAFAGKTTITFTYIDEVNTPCTLYVDSEGGVVEPEPTELYLVGEITDWEFKDEYKFTREGNVYTLTLMEGISAGANEEGWKIASSDWITNLGCYEGQELLNEVPFEFLGGDDPDNFVVAFEGPTTLTVTEENGVYTLLVKNEGTDGVAEIEAAAEEAVYFNLQGVKVANPANGIYVKVVAGKAEKVVIAE